MTLSTWLVFSLLLRLLLLSTANPHQLSDNVIGLLKVYMSLAGLSATTIFVFYLWVYTQHQDPLWFGGSVTEFTMKTVNIFIMIACSVGSFVVLLTKEFKMTKEENEVLLNKAKIHKPLNTQKKTQLLTRPSLEHCNKLWKSDCCNGVYESSKLFTALQESSGLANWFMQTLLDTEYTDFNRLPDFEKVKTIHVCNKPLEELGKCWEAFNCLGLPTPLHWYVVLSGRTITGNELELVIQRNDAIKVIPYHSSSVSSANASCQKFEVENPYADWKSFVLAESNLRYNSINTCYSFSVRLLKLFSSQPMEIKQTSLEVVESTIELLNSEACSIEESKLSDLFLTKEMMIRNSVGDF